MNKIETLRALAAESEPDAAEILSAAADTMADLLAALLEALRYIEVQVAYRGAMTAAEVEAAIVGPTAPSEVEIGANSCSTLARFDFCAARAAIANAD